MRTVPTRAQPGDRWEECPPGSESPPTAICRNYICHVHQNLFSIATNFGLLEKSHFFSIKLHTFPSQNITFKDQIRPVDELTNGLFTETDTDFVIDKLSARISCFEQGLTTLRLCSHLTSAFASNFNNGFYGYK